MLEVSLKNFIEGDTSILNTAKGGIHLGILPQNVDYPVVNIIRSQGRVIHRSLSGTNNLRDVPIEIRTWANNYIQARQVEDLIRTRLVDKEGDMEGTTVQDLYEVDSWDEIDEIREKSIAVIKIVISEEGA